MATRTWLARAGACLAASVVAVALAACGSPTDPSPSSSATSGSASAFTALPESVLPAVTGVSYVASESSRAALARTHVGSTLSAFSGGIARDLVSGGNVVGVVQVYRFADGVAAADRERFLPMLVYVDTGVQPVQQPLGGKKVQVVSSVPGQDRTVIAWAAGDEVVLLSAADLATAREYAGRWILADF